MTQRRQRGATGNNGAGKGRGTAQGKVKKLTAKELKAQAEEEARELARQSERERQDELTRLEEDRKLQEELARKVQEEQREREVMLAASEAQWQSTTAEWWREQFAARQDEAWLLYVDCDPLPEVLFPRRLNQYLSAWRDSSGTRAPAEVFQRVHEVVTVLERLQEILEEPLDMDPVRAARLQRAKVRHSVVSDHM